MDKYKESKNIQLLAYFYLLKGRIFSEKGEYDLVIEYCQKAFDTPGFDIPGNALNNIGLAYSNKGNYGRAIEYCQKAFDTPGFDTPGRALSNMGNAYYNKGDYDRAIEYFQKALETPGFDIPGNALYNMGLAYYNKGNYDRAIEYFQKASTEFEDLGENEYVRKISYLIINLTIENKIGRERFEASSISDISDKIFKEDFIKKTALKDPGEKIKQILNEFNITAYQKYAEEYESRENDTNKQIDDDFLIILKGWSSSIPLVSGRINEYFEGNICKGGGYFIRWKGAGLVIDPGINFLENFHENKFHIADIDIVLITHNHLDHNYELLQINDAFYQTNKFLKNVKRQRYILDKETLDGKRSDLYKDIIEIETPFDTGTIDSGERDLKEKYNIIIKLFKTEHSKDVEHSTGAIIELFEQKDDNEPIIKIGLTSDTKYFPGLSEKLVDCDLIIPHFGMLDKKELDDENDDVHDTHLGFNGMKKIIEGTNADLYAITEFWGGRGDFRVDLIRKIIFDLNEKKKIKNIIAGDVGCKIKLPSKHIICSNCNTVSNYKTTSTVRPEKSFGKLRYLCENCHSEMSTRL
ncbi:MAG: tetratricopeptide repeat protein [Methanosarcinales archaeon]|nr:tetratricopeptide repeat protein [Methanosarcinales archaeon]MCD4815805.1 tetratricopeptide repeat protein [Methanosarcinales archaeon]